MTMPYLQPWCSVASQCRRRRRCRRSLGLRAGAYLIQRSVAELAAIVMPISIRSRFGVEGGLSSYRICQASETGTLWAATC